MALFTPSDNAIADVLSDLAAPVSSSAESIWGQVVPALAAGETRVDQALDVLLHKFQRPVEALVAGHYVLRFLPKRLPVQWAENLVRAFPFVSDGPMIAAWGMIYNRPQGATDSDVDAVVARNVALALERPITAFARSRLLLFEARHFVPDNSAAESRWGLEETFRRAGAAAGGLESYWGSAGCGRPSRRRATRSKSEESFPWWPSVSAGVSMCACSANIRGLNWGFRRTLRPFLRRML